MLSVCGGRGQAESESRSPDSDVLDRIGRLDFTPPTRTDVRLELILLTRRVELVNLISPTSFISLNPHTYVKRSSTTPNLTSERKACAAEFRKGPILISPSPGPVFKITRRNGQLWSLGAFGRTCAKITLPSCTPRTIIIFREFKSNSNWILNKLGALRLENAADVNKLVES